MIDDKELKHRQIMASIFGPHDEVEIIRNARRYLALRKAGVVVDGVPCARLVSNDQLDAAADRLLEGGE